MLLGLSLAISAVLIVAHIPAALLLGPMLAAILMATNGARLAVPQIPFLAAHALIGCIVADHWMSASSRHLQRIGRSFW